MTAERKYPQISPAPDWAAIMRKRPDLEAPGFQEALQQARSRDKEK